MLPIELTALEVVVGGGSEVGFASAGPNRLEIRNLFSTTRTALTDYGYCVGTMERVATQKHPDTRSFVGRWLGRPDGNADTRAEWVRTAIPGACGTAPTS